MSIARSATAAAVAVFGLLLTTPATASGPQDDGYSPPKVNLECYQIKGYQKPIYTRLRTYNQFGREQILSITPDSLCLPTRKTCCDQWGCAPEKCGDDPSWAREEGHFKCYKVEKVSTCGDKDPDCTYAKKVDYWKTRAIVNLTDQFGYEDHVQIGQPQRLCVPVDKKVVTSTSSTSTSTSTTSTTTSSTTTTTHKQKECGDYGDFKCEGSCKPNPYTGKSRYCQPKYSSGNSNHNAKCICK